MNNSFYSELAKLSDENHDVKEHVRERHSEERNKQYEWRDQAMAKAAGELFDSIMNNGLMDKMKSRATDGYYELMIFAVSLDPSMDTFASHEPQKPFIVTNYNNVDYTFTYRSLFWTPRWKELFGGFQLNYKWNKPQTLLSVYISWGSR